MSNREAKVVARQWVDSSEYLADDLRKLLVQMDQEYLEPAVEGNSERTIVVPKAAEAVEMLFSCDRALWEYRRMIPETLVKFEMWQPLLQAMRSVQETGVASTFNGLADIEVAVLSVELWAKRQAYKAVESPLRCDILKVTIEEIDDELIVRTDKDGSVKLRGTVNVPMFMAFWRAPKHRLSNEMFLDIDPTSTMTYLERHRTRLCAKLQQVLLEVVVEGNGFRLQKCRN
jgi:hypothetical protein